jgi:hypothetical protein
MLEDLIEQAGGSSCSAREVHRDTEHHLTEHTYREVRDGTGHKEEAAGTVGLEQEKSPVPLQRLIALLKTYFFVSENFIACVAPSVGIAPEKLKRMFDELGKLRLERKEAIHSLQERFHCQYHRCLTYCKRLANVAGDSSLQCKLAKRLVQARSCCVIMKKRLAAMNADVSNQQIAQVLGIPDTVNSLQK